MTFITKDTYGGAKIDHRDGYYITYTGNTTLVIQDETLKRITRLNQNYYELKGNHIKQYESLHTFSACYDYWYRNRCLWVRFLHLLGCYEKHQEGRSGTS